MLSCYKTSHDTAHPSKRITCIEASKGSSDSPMHTCMQDGPKQPGSSETKRNQYQVQIMAYNRRRIQAEANAWRNVEGVTVYRKIYRKLKGKVLDYCVVPASTYGFETLALSELHQHKLKLCKNNWIRKIAGVRRVERRRMKDLRGEVGNKACIVGKIVKSRIKWAGHVVPMKDDKLPKRAETKKHEGSRKRGRPQLRW